MKQRKKDRQTERKILYLKHLSIEIPKKHFFPLIIQILKVHLGISYTIYQKSYTFSDF